MLGRGWRNAVGLAAVAALVAMAWAVPVRQERTYPAVVHAGRTFTLASIEPGHFLWSLREGRTPGGNGLVSERVLVFDRSELVEVAVGDGLETGMPIARGEPVAVVRSLRTARERDELLARRDALASRRDLLLAGDRDAAVREAEQRVALAEAERRAGRSQLERLRVLAAQGLASEAELELAEDQDTVLQQAVEVARAGVELVRSAARPEAVSEAEAALREVEASLTELDARAEMETVTTPIAGVVELGRAGAELGDPGAELRVTDLSEVYLAVAVPAADIARVAVGAPARFRVPAFPDREFPGEVVALGTSAVPTLSGERVFWASVRIPEPQGLLHDGIQGGAAIGPQRSWWRRLLEGWRP